MSWRGHLSVKYGNGGDNYDSGGLGDYPPIRASGPEPIGLLDEGLSDNERKLAIAAALGGAAWFFFFKKKTRRR